MGFYFKSYILHHRIFVASDSYSAGNGLTYDKSTGEFRTSQDLSETGDVQFNNLDLTGRLKSDGDVIVGGVIYGDGGGLSDRSIPNTALSGITSVEILDNTLTSQDINEGAIETGEILDGTIIADDIAIGAVGSAEILNDTILEEDLATDSVTAKQIQTGAVESLEIKNGTILDEDISDSTKIAFDKLNIVGSDIRGLIPYTATDGITISSGGEFGLPQALNDDASPSFEALTVSGNITIGGKFIGDGSQLHSIMAEKVVGLSFSITSMQV